MTRSVVERGSIALVIGAIGFAIGASCTEDEGFACTEAGERELFDKRIAPLLADDRPSSCNECHLSGVDLDLFVQDSPCRTMACMLDRGVVDLEDPEASIVLGWIERAEATSPLVTEAMIREEYEGMLEWIRFTARCGQLECEPVDDPCGFPPSALDCDLASPDESQPFDDPGDCSERTLEAMFAAKVYAWRGRCYPCHFADETSEIGAPPWIQVGDCDVGSLATMREVLARGYVDTNDPARSLLLLKPLTESEGGVVHGGHDKIASTQEAAYVDFLAWLQRYAECR